MVWVFLLLFFLCHHLRGVLIFLQVGCVFFFFFGWLVHGRFVGFVCTGYDRRLDDDLLFYVGFLVFFLYL